VPTGNTSYANIVFWPKSLKRLCCGTASSTRNPMPQLLDHNSKRKCHTGPTGPLSAQPLSSPKILANNASEIVDGVAYTLFKTDLG